MLYIVAQLTSENVLSITLPSSPAFLSRGSTPFSAEKHMFAPCRRAARRSSRRPLRAVACPRGWVERAILPAPGSSPPFSIIEDDTVFTRFMRGMRIIRRHVPGWARELTSSIDSTPSPTLRPQEPPGCRRPVDYFPPRASQTSVRREKVWFLRWMSYEYGHAFSSQLSHIAGAVARTSRQRVAR